MKTKRFSLPNLDLSLSKKSKEMLKKVLTMPQNHNLKNKKSFLTIEQLTAEIMKYDKIDIRLTEMDGIDLPGVQFILAIMDGHKNIKLDIDIEKDINTKLIDPRFNIVSRNKIIELKNG